MKFSVGDKIKLRKTGEEGEVIDIIQNEYLRVRVNGVVIPAEEADLDFPYLDWFLKDRADKRADEKKRLKGKNVFIDNIKVDKSEHTAESLFAKGAYLLFQPVYREHEGEDIIHRFVVYLFSEWPIQLDYLVNVSIRGKSLFSFEGELKFQQRQLLYSLPFEEATDNPVFNFEIKETHHSKVETHRFSIKLNRKRLIDNVQRLERENLALFELPIFKELLPSKKLEIPVIGGKTSGLTVLGTPRTQLKAKVEIDLHIEKIEKNFDHLDNTEKIAIQLDYFHKYLDLALADESINPLRVIHGIGAGVLRKEIESICRSNPQVRDFGSDRLNPGVTLLFF